jgi:glycerol uptake operon antiterminator
MNSLENLFERNPVVAAIRSVDELNDVENSNVSIVFLLGEKLSKLKRTIEQVKKVNRLSFVHIDLIEGLAKNEASIEYLAEEVKPDGIITTKTNLIKIARKQGLLTVQRIFLIDSQSISTGIRLVNSVSPDFVEVMPGVIPYTIKILSEELKEPIIAGGMIMTKADIISALNSGACGVSTSKHELWRV